MATVTALASHLLSLLRPTDQKPADQGQTKLTMTPNMAPNTTTSAATPTVPQVDAARLAFYHFLKNLCDPGEPLTSTILERFLRRSLQHAHWQENKDALFSEIASSLQHFSNQYNEPLPILPFALPSDLQVVKAESFASLERVVESWVQNQLGPTEQVRIVRDQDEKLLVCRLQLDRSFSVHIFDRQLCIREGRLEPLVDDMALFYDSNLMLDSHRPSQIEIAPHAIARFRSASTHENRPTGVKGVTVRGFTFQKTLGLDGAECHRYPTLFYPLKRIEQFFVNRNSDPLYVELTSLLERASDLLADEQTPPHSQNHADAKRFAEAALERGRLAFEQVFVEDRLLRLLLENLERALKLDQAASPNSILGTDLRPEAPPRPAIDKALLDSALGLRLEPGQEFIEVFGPDLVELQEAEKCETIAPVNQKPINQKPMETAKTLPKATPASANQANRGANPVPPAAVRRPVP